MLSDKEIVCPNNLLDVAHQKKGISAGIVNAGKSLTMMSVMDAINENLIIPIFIGDKEEINKCASDLNFDISSFKIIDEKSENKTAEIAADLASKESIKIIVKGHIHTDVLMKEVIKKAFTPGYLVRGYGTYPLPVLVSKYLENQNYSDTTRGVVAGSISASCEIPLKVKTYTEMLKSSKTISLLRYFF